MKKENFKDGISFNYIYILISSGLSVGLSACTGEMERKSLACIQLDFLLSVKWKNCWFIFLGTTLLTHCIGIWLTLLKTEEAKAVEGMDRKQKKVIKAEYQKKGRRVLILGILILLR